MEYAEDDTFRALSRPSLEEISRFYKAWMIEQGSFNWTVGDRTKFLKSYDWSFREFVDAHTAKKIKLPHD